MQQQVNPLHQEMAFTIPDVATAQREIDEHCARCPGTHLEVYGDRGREALRQAWVDEKYRLMARLETAKAWEASGWRWIGEPPVVAQAAPARPGRVQPRKPIQELVNCFHDKLAIMAEEAPLTPRWVAARNQAYHYAYMIRERSKEEGIPAPDLPAVPLRPKRKHASKAEEMADYHARRKEGAILPVGRPPVANPGRKTAWTRRKRQELRGVIA